MMGVTQPTMAWLEEKEVAAGGARKTPEEVEEEKAAKRKDILSMALGTYEVRGKSDAADWKVRNLLKYPAVNDDSR